MTSWLKACLQNQCNHFWSDFPIKTPVIEPIESIHADPLLSDVGIPYAVDQSCHKCGKMRRVIKRGETVLREIRMFEHRL